MILAPQPSNESERLRELMRYEVLHTQYEEDFDDIVRLASSICETPISTITLIAQNQQWFKAHIGVPHRDGDRDTSFCGHAIMGTDLMVVPDALQDERFADNPLVQHDPSIRFYAGCPLISANGFPLGTLCVIDRIPRQLNPTQEMSLKVLSGQVVKLFELRLRNREIESQRARLEEFGTVQNKIISIISHDVRGPLASLKSLLELVRSDQVSPEDAKNLFGILDKQLDGTMGMLTNLVEWGGLLMRKPALDIGTVDLHNLVEHKIIPILAPFADPKKNQIRSLIRPGLRVRGDEYALRFILRNILSNANKYTSEGIIQLSATEKPDGIIQLQISDNGCGMDETQLKNLFQWDQKRKSREGTHREKGSGLGLILAREFAESMRVTIEATSNPGEGTIFTLILHEA